MIKPKLLTEYLLKNSSEQTHLILMNMTDGGSCISSTLPPSKKHIQSLIFTIYAIYEKAFIAEYVDFSVICRKVGADLVLCVVTDCIASGKILCNDLAATLNQINGTE